MKRISTRALDIGLSLIALLVLLPLIQVIALAIRLDSRGPILARETRVGADGRTLVPHRFRTMAVDAGLERSTRLGRLLRETRLDELPKLWSVLMGHVSLIGASR